MDEVDFPVSNMRTIFIQLNEALNEGIEAGFTREEAFQLVKIMHEVNWAASTYIVNQEEGND